MIFHDFDFYPSSILQHFPLIMPFQEIEEVKTLDDKAHGCNRDKIMAAVDFILEDGSI